MTVRGEREPVRLYAEGVARVVPDPRVDADHGCRSRPIEERRYVETRGAERGEVAEVAAAVPEEERGPGGRSPTMYARCPSSLVKG